MTVGSALHEDAFGRDGAMDKAIGGPGAAPVSGPQPSDVMMCGSCEDWLRPDCDLHRGMQVRRPPSWAEVQKHVDEMADRDAFGGNGTLVEDVPLDTCGGSEELLRQEFSARARDLLERAMGVGLPEWISQQIQLDIEEIGTTIVRMLPSTPKVILKVEMMGENSCPRWHQDKYTGRAIVSYNGGSGTEYLDHDNVDFWELTNCGMCDKIAIRRDEVFSAGIGDILFMKGSKFPSAVNGLVHKSPQKLYHPGGSVANRLVLKVDVP